MTSIQYRNKPHKLDFMPATVFITLHKAVIVCHPYDVMKMATLQSLLSTRWLFEVVAGGSYGSGVNNEVE